MAAAAEGFDWRTLVSGLSSLLQSHQVNAANARARSDLEAGQIAARQKQQQADAAIGNQVSSLAAGPTQPQQHSLAAYTAALQRVRAAPSSSSVPNLGSGRYQAGVENADTAVRGYGANQAFNLSEIDAAQRQRETEQQGAASLGSNLKTLAGAGDTDLYLAKLRAAREQPNPWITMLGQIGERIGKGYVTKGERLDRKRGVPTADVGQQYGGGVTVDPYSGMPISPVDGEP